jgi:single-strand DNA-binding protein
MASLNKVLIMGNLTRDPESRKAGEASVVRFGVAVNRKYSTKEGEQREEVCFVDVEAWRRQGELVMQYLRKGSPVFVEGRLRFDQWDDRDSGRKRSNLSVVADHVTFLPSREGQGQQGFEGGGYGQPQQPQPAQQPQYGQAPQQYAPPAQPQYAAPPQQQQAQFVPPQPQYPQQPQAPQQQSYPQAPQAPQQQSYPQAPQQPTQQFAPPPQQQYAPPPATQQFPPPQAPPAAPPAAAPSTANFAVPPPAAPPAAPAAAAPPPFPDEKMDDDIPF